MPEPIEVCKVPIESVSDAHGLDKLIADGVIEADRVVAVIGKTEGNGGVNDYTRIIADRAFREVLRERGTRPMEEIRQIPLVWSGGTDGIISPHATIFATIPAGKAVASSEPRLSVGYTMSEQIFAEDIGRPAMVQKVAAGVRDAMTRAGITEPTDVHYVQTKTPLLTLETITEARGRGKDVVTDDTLKSMDISNSTTALGIAVALGEIGMPRPEQNPPGSLALLLRRLMLQRGRTRPRADRRRRQRSGHRRALPHRAFGDAGRTGCRRDLGGDPWRRAGAARPAAAYRPTRSTSECLPQVRGGSKWAGTRPTEYHAGRLRRPLAPSDQGMRRRGRRSGDRRPGSFRLRRRRAPGSAWRRSGSGHRQPRRLSLAPIAALTRMLAAEEGMTRSPAD